MKIVRLSTLSLSAALLLASCKKEKEDYFRIPPAEAHFQNATSGSFYVQNTPNATFKIPLGITTVANVPRTITVSVTSPTGATAGTQYSLASTSVTIPAGQVIDSLPVRGIFAGLGGGRVDTLVFRITGGDVTPSAYNSTYRLVLQGYCDVNLNMFTGPYNIQDYDDAGAPDGGPYGVTITPGTTTGTTGTITIAGLWGVPTPITVNLNWTSAANFTATIPDQNFYVHSQYGQVKIRQAGAGTFSSCNNTLLLAYEAYVPGVGTFGTFTSVLNK